MTDGRGTAGRVGDALAVARHHIVLVAMAASLVFGWLLTGRHHVVLALVVGLDWFLINLLNRVTDVEEDRRNDIRGTAMVARRARLLTALGAALMVGSFVATHAAWPQLTPFRVAVQLIGLGYNYDVVPTPRGLRRFKEIYFLKNAMSAALFVLTGFAYVIAIDPEAVRMPWAGVAALVLFFVPFELTYEILYDLRDLDGDRAEGVPTYPVVHGPLVARRIVDGLLVGSAVVLVAGLLAGALGVREGLMIAAPAIQYAFYRPRFARGLTSRDCVVVTHLGTALLLFYLAGNAVWLGAGLPPNVFLVGG